MSDLSLLVMRCIRFANWAAGEGICPEAFANDTDPVNPDEILFAYSSATDDTDWDTLAVRIGEQISELEELAIDGMVSEALK